MARYETVFEAAKRWRTDPATLRDRCARGEIRGARMSGGSWLIPTE